MSSSQWESLLEKFAKAFKTLGIYLYDSGRFVVLSQTDALGLAILRRHLIEPPTTELLTFAEESGPFTAIVNDLPDTSIKIIVLCHENDLSSIHKHWKRTYKVIAKKIPVDNIVEEENFQTRMVRSVDAIDKNLDQVIVTLKSLQLEENR